MRLRLYTDNNHFPRKILCNGLLEKQCSVLQLPTDSLDDSTVFASIFQNDQIRRDVEAYGSV